MKRIEVENGVSATAKYVRMAPRKVRLVVDQIRNKSVSQALELLQFAEVAAAVPVEKVLRSAVANAENNNNLSADSLIVKSAIIENGPVLKRFKAAARGSAAPRRKKMSHIRIVLTDGNTN